MEQPEHDHVTLARAGLEAAPTLLESYFWAWLVGAASFELYREELAITDLIGPGHVPDDFVGEP